MNLDGETGEEQTTVGRTRITEQNRTELFILIVK